MHKSTDLQQSFLDPLEDPTTERELKRLGGDLLQLIFDRQTQLHERVIDDPDLGWHNESRALNAKSSEMVMNIALFKRPPHNPDTLQLVDNADMLAFEAMELKDHLPWKKHKRDYARPLTKDEREAAIEEAVDCLHLLLNCFNLLGVRTSREIAGRYLAKNAVNHQRQDNSY